MAHSKRKHKRREKQRLVDSGLSIEAVNALGADTELTANESSVSVGKKDPSYSGIAYTGGTLTQPSFPHPMVIDLAGVKIAKDPQVSLYGHDANKPVGHHKPVVSATDIRVEDGKFSVPGETTDMVVEAGKANFPWQMSVRGPIKKMRFVKEGKEVKLNGRTFTGPLYVVDKFLFRETSWTGLGADQGSPEAAIAASLAKKGVVMSDDSVSTPVEDAPEQAADVVVTEAPVVEVEASEGETPVAEAPVVEEVVAEEAPVEDVVEAPEAEEAPEVEEAPEAEEAPEEPTEEVEEAPEAPVAEEAPAAEEAPVQEAAASAPEVTEAPAELAASEDTPVEEAAPVADLSAAYVEQQNAIAMVERVFGQDSIYAELKASAITNGWDEDTCQKEKLTMTVENSAPEGFVARDIEAGLNMNDVLACSMAISAGVPADSVALDSYSDDVRDLAASAEYRGASWHSAIHHAANAAGRSLRVGAQGQELLAAAQDLDMAANLRRAGGEVAASQGWSTLDLGVLTVDVLNKVLYSKFAMYPSIMNDICSVSSARDFRPNHKYRINGGGFMNKVAKTGELEHKHFEQTEFSNSIDTVGVMLSAPRKSIVNDDLGVFEQLGTEFGRGAAKTLERDIIAALYDAHSWDATCQINNVFDATGLDAGLDLYTDLTDTDGTPIDVVPSVLLVQSGSMYRQALSLVNGGDIAIPEPSTNHVVSGNTLTGIVSKVISSPWLKNAAVANSSSTGWFLLASPSELPVIEVLFLNGQQAPTIERAETTFNTLGAQWRAFFDYGIASVNNIGIVRSTGTV